MKIKGKDLVVFTRNILLVVLGTIVLAFGTAIFIIPMNIVCGGVSGLAIVIDKLIPIEIITVDVIVFVLTWVLFFVGLVVLGKAFAAKTLISTIIYPIALSLLMRLCDPEILGGFFYLRGYPSEALVLMISALVGGVTVGFGCALTFIGGGSTGGVDILAFALCKAFPRLKSSRVIFFVDAMTVVFGMFVIQDLVISLLGILAAFIMAVMVDKVFLGGRAAFVAYIVTEKYRELNDYIIKTLNRGSTLIDVTGGYTGDGKKMIMVSFVMSQYAEILGAVGKIDPSAFVIVHRAHEINGEGWSRPRGSEKAK
jgi:uncharacterized membrane-anchored protein YitT (DUF2179 family)